MEKANILFDTDIGADCDDAGALALLHRLCDRREATLSAVTACYASPYAAGCIDAINAYYGRSVAVGINHGTPPFEKSVYAEALCTTFPNRYPAERVKDVPDTLAVLRQTLADAPDRSITFVVTGMLTSAAKLLESRPDAISPLSGRSLIEQKIARTVIMGGNFADPTQAEWNIRCDIPAAQTVVAGWPGELIFSGFEIGAACVSLCDYARLGSPDDPARLAYALHPSGKHGRASWDLTAMLEAVRPGQYWDYHPHGRITVDDSGITTWHPAQDSRHTFLLPRNDAAELHTVMDGLVLGQ